MCYNIANEEKQRVSRKSRRERKMFEVIVKVNGTNRVKYVETIGQAIQWIRGFAGDATEWYIHNQNGDLYPYHS